MPKQNESYQSKAKRLIGSNKYLVLATCGVDSRPWASPVFFAHDSEYNLYFISAVDSQHCKNIIQNPFVGVAIFDSAQRVGSSEGVQIEARASMVGKTDIKKIIGLYFRRLSPGSKAHATEQYNPSDYLEPSEFRFFKVSIIKAYVTGVERRVEVDLLETT